MNASKRIKYFRTGLVLATSLLLWNPLQASAVQQNGGGAEKAASGKAGGPTMLGVSGKVLETMNSGGYTYALVDMGGDQTTWVALPMSQIAVGSEINCQPGALMKNFNSSTLHRSFERIVFSRGLVPAEGAAVPPPATAATPAEPVKISKAEGPNAYTIAEIFKKKSTLAKKPVVVQGKVVKVSWGIMGKNWLHLQDGTGSSTAGDNDLVVTTDAMTDIGHVVTIKGKLSLNRDFGSGYKYDIIVEGAEVTEKK